MGSTIQTYQALLKERYLNSSTVERLMYDQNTLFARMQKKSSDPDMVGLDLKVPLITANPQGLGGIFSSAQTNATNVKSSAWAITAGDYYGSVLIGDKVIQASRNNNGAFLQAKTVEIDGLYEEAGDAWSNYLFGNGGQRCGVVGAINGNDITLNPVQDIVNFEVGMTVDASANDGSDSSHTLRAGSTTVAAINRATGVITLTNAAAITGLAVGDSLFRDSDFFGNVGTVICKGIQAYMPATDGQVNTALWGISGATRATDVQRYGGCRADPSELAGKTIEERIRKLSVMMSARFKAKPFTVGYLNPEDFDILNTNMVSRGLRPLEVDDAQFGFARITLMTPNGAVPIYTDRHCPKDQFFGLREDNWWISSMGEMFHPQGSETNSDLLFFRPNSTDWEFRLINYGLLACNAPKNNGRCSLV